MSTLVAADTLMNTIVQTYACSPVPFMWAMKDTYLALPMKYCLVENGHSLESWMIDHPQQTSKYTVWSPSNNQSTLLQQNSQCQPMVFPTSDWRSPHIHSTLRTEALQKAPPRRRTAVRSNKAKTQKPWYVLMGNGSYPLANKHSYWKWPIYSWFTYSRWWFSIAMLVYQAG